MAAGCRRKVNLCLLRLRLLVELERRQEVESRLLPDDPGVEVVLLGRASRRVAEVLGCIPSTGLHVGARRLSYGMKPAGRDARPATYLCKALVDRVLLPVLQPRPDEVVLSAALRRQPFGEISADLPLDRRGAIFSPFPENRDHPAVEIDLAPADSQ